MIKDIVNYFRDLDKTTKKNIVKDVMGYLYILGFVAVSYIFNFNDQENGTLLNVAYIIFSFPIAYIVLRFIYKKIKGVK